jgi:hypothetical protein
MQQILNVLTPATATAPAGPYDLVTLAEMKMKLLIDPSNTKFDPLLSELITNISDTIARMCNRVFAYEKVEETFYQLEDSWRTQRLYLSRWPVALKDITAFTQNGVDISSWFVTAGNPIYPGGAGVTNCVLEGDTGTIYLPSFLGAWCGTIDVSYSGGYQLPDGAPGLLKFAVEALIRESYMSWIRDPSLFGVRQIRHKESSLGYYGPNMFPTIGLPDTWKAITMLLNKFIRHWV